MALTHKLGEHKFAEGRSSVYTLNVNLLDVSSCFMVFVFFPLIL